MEELKHKCGVVGVYSPDKDFNVSHLLFDGLLILQHRGEESAGISVFGGKKIRSVKGMGHVNEAITESDLSRLFGNIGIGHTRYSTAGSSSPENIQPYTIDLGDTEFALAFNGNLTNHLELKRNLIRRGHTFMSDADTEIIAHILINNLMEYELDYTKAIEKIIEVIEGAYSIVLINNKGQFYSFRDPLGFRPLCIGRLSEGAYMVASESVVFDILDVEFIRDIEPGEILLIENSSIKSSKTFTSYVESQPTAHCMFEYVYFSRPDSILDSISVHQVRLNLGKILARLHPVNADMVVPIPDSGRVAAIGYSQESGIPLIEGLIRNRSIWRTFILPYPELRERYVKLKLNPVKEAIKGKRVVLIDDSIVRSTTSRRIVNIVRKAGAKEVHLRISCPPIISPCYMGIDFPSKEELVAANKSVEEIRQTIGADSLGYMTVEGLIKAIGLSSNRLCLACLTGRYPIMKARNIKQKKLIDEKIDGKTNKRGGII
ncbi:MAG: amidophosphoribosyltransferase [Candidatus Odinarchaeia archaeon]